MDNNIENQLNNFQEKNNEQIEDELQKAYKQAEQISLIPLLKLIYKTTKLDLYKDYKLKYKLSSKESIELKGGEIIMSNENKKIKVYLDVVDKNYNLTNSINDCRILSENVYDLNKEPNEPLKKQIIYIITLLTQSIKIVFDNLKNKYKELTEYNLTLSDNTTVYLYYELEYRICVLFKEVIE